MAAEHEYSLLAAVCDFGWGSLGKLRLILDRLSPTAVSLYGEGGINHTAIELLDARHRFVQRPPGDADVAVVINDPAAANRIADLGVPVIYVDSLPYLWATDAEVPDRRAATCYCAQKFPFDRLPLAKPLRDRRDIYWIDPIVPRSAHRRAGQGVVVNVGGLHSHLAGDTFDAYLRLVLFPAIAGLEASGRRVSAVCGNLPSGVCRQVRELLPDCRAIGRQSPYEFERLLRGADLLVTSPGSTTILQALSLELPALLLPPQNLSQMLNAQLFSSPGAARLEWPASVMTCARVDELRPHGEDAVLTYMYECVSNAATSPEASADVAAAIQAALGIMPAGGVLDRSVSALGTNGAVQVAQLIKQAMLAPVPRVE